MTTTMRVPVFVAGGGAGSTASMLLSAHGMEALLSSALPTTCEEHDVEIEVRPAPAAA